MTTVASFFTEWKADVLSGKPPITYPVGSGFESIPLGPKRVLVIGAPPGKGKTALVMQWTFEALRINSTLRAVVCNVEMAASDLLERELARVSGVPLSEIQSRSFTKHPAAVEKVKQGIEAIAAVSDRLAFVPPPFALDHIAAVVDDHKASLIVLDYIQRITPQSDGQSKDTRQQNTEAMTIVRQFANEGMAVIVVSAVARDKGSSGRAYANMGLGSFKESGELEFAADVCYLLEHDEKSADGAVMLRQVKGRYAANSDITCRFVGHLQKFIGGANGC